MKATFVELRTKSSEIIQALERNESVTILYRGRPTAVMQPIAEAVASAGRAKEHAAFGLWKDRNDLKDVSTAVRTLRRVGSMLFDTDVLIWVLRGNAKAARAVDAADSRSLSVVTYMELLQGARDKGEVKAIKSFLADMQFRLLPLSENIGHRASIYLEEYGLSASMSMADALIAAAAIEANEPLLTGNDRHYKPIKELEAKRFRP